MSSPPARRSLDILFEPDTDFISIKKIHAGSWRLVSPGNAGNNLIIIWGPSLSFCKLILSGYIRRAMRHSFEFRAP